MKETDEMKRLLEVLHSGGTILYPTDTIWGLGCDATNKDAIEQVYLLKQRLSNRMMIVLVNGTDMLADYVEEIPSVAHDLMSGVKEPLTIIYPQAKNLPATILGSDGSIAIRIPRDDFCLELITAFGKPIVSTSANVSGSPFPLFRSQVASEILDSVDYAVKKQPEHISKPRASAIIKITPGGDIQVIRN